MSARGRRGVGWGLPSAALTLPRVLSPPPAVELWSGIGKGPPRKLKFPDPAAVVEALKSSLA